MAIEIVSGDLLDALDNRDVDVIGHIVNCQGVMGSGIAKSIKQRYPSVYEIYFNTCLKSEDKSNLLGLAEGCYIAKQKWVYNLHAQLDYGTYKRQLNYGAIAECLIRMAYEADPRCYIGFPFKMGSDRAGGDWTIVLEMIEFYFKDHSVKIYKL